MIFQRRCLLTLVSLFSIVSCKVYTSKTIYQVGSRENHWTIQTLNVDNSKYTQLYITHYQDKKIDFRIFYTDSLVRKTIYVPPNYSQRKNVKVLLATEKENYLLPLDSLDKIIFTTIARLNDSNSNIFYKLKGRSFKGYVLDPKYD